MYLSELKLWNYRKYGLSDITKEPSLTVNFKKGVNVLIGENDSGKTAIIDAIKQVLLTQTHDYIFIDSEDFFKDKNGLRSEELKIECIFSDFKDEEAANFLEWGNFNDNNQFELQIRLIARKKNNRIFTDIKAGIEGSDLLLDSDVRDLLRVTYLKPLRDAENELSAGKKSRLAQILKSHKLFIEKKNNNGDKEDHIFEKYIKDFNILIEEYFNKEKVPDGKGNEIEAAKSIKDNLDKKLKEFFPNNENYLSNINFSNSNLIDVLHKLNLLFDDNKSGLGSLNLLFIAIELLLLETEIEKNNPLNLVLIEEIEAHLHSQAQIRVIEYLQKNDFKNIQIILTTHSINITSKIKLENLIICKNKNVYPMGEDYTKLSQGDYKFLERFLDDTKANLFFARGVIIVEGDAENLIIPTLAELLGRPLYKYGVSIVNVGSTALLRYADIFKRKSDPKLDIRISIITDLDIKPKEYYSDKDNKDLDSIDGNKKTKLEMKNKKYNFDENIKGFVSPDWTLEYVIALSGLKEYLYQAILHAKEIKSKDDYWLENYNITDSIKEIKQFEKNGKKPEEIAYEIYNPLFNKSASKAVTAQIFSILINEHKKDVTKLLKSDQKISYLREAIEHVTEKIEDSNDN
ncbi:MAG TPA: AAA family ATPase [Spirochaetota bacterium]|nr:AAA family ATPase [Spirochaetota bacterium]